ncbi:MBL fold metallo-hydrolase [Virgibacillus sediminis]|uniref:MBL fold metallo-hydrolase n=1 Tax=Virgibacillus sediminis TaxID=202260 RepID=A0ABV7A2E0_9BACI
MLKKLTERVHYMPPYGETDRPALGLISGDTYSLVVDSGNSPAHAADFLEEVQNLEVAPATFLVLTHWHWDHIFGMKTMDLLSISHEDTKQKIDHLKTLNWDDASLDERVVTGEEIEFCRDMIKREMPVRDELELKAPEVTFNDRMEINLGGITCVVEHAGGEHAPDSSIVYVPEEKVMFLGDCIYQDFYSGEWSYDLDKLSLLVSKIRKYEVDCYVTGHQDPKNHKEMQSFLDDLLSIGEMVGQEVIVDEAVARFTEVRETKPTEEQLEFIQNFVIGNQKKTRNGSHS